MFPRGKIWVYLPTETRVKRSGSAPPHSMNRTDFDFPEGHIPRRGRLMASGIILALIGSLACLNVVGTAFSMFTFGMLPTSGMSPDEAAELEGMRKMMRITNTINLLFYGGTTAFLLTVALGQIFLKRWSRPLALIIAWLGVYLGLFSLASILVTGPMMREMMSADMAMPSPSPGAGGAPAPPVSTVPPPDAFFGIMMAVMVAFFFVFGVLVPILLIWLNWHRDVRVTLEFCDRKERWTDACPIPVLGISVFASIAAISCLASLAIPWVPFFGQVLTGTPARLFVAAVLLLLLFISWATYRRMLAGWIAAVLLLLAGFVSTYLSLPSMDFADLYREMGMPSDLVEQFAGEDSPFRSFLQPSGLTLGLMVAAILPPLAYLLWALRFFLGRNRDSAPPEPA